MNVYDFIDRKVTDLVERIDSTAQRLVFWTKLSNDTATGENDAVEGWPTEGAEPRGQQKVRRTSSWGVAGRPPAGVLTAVVRALAGSAAGVIVGIATGKYGRQDLKTGETQLYCKVAGCELYLDENGKLQINSAAGQDTVVNGGSKAVGRVDDATGTGTLSCTVAGPALGVYTLTLLWTPQGGGTPTTLASWTAPGATPGSPATLVGKITAGAARFKA